MQLNLVQFRGKQRLVLLGIVVVVLVGGVSIISGRAASRPQQPAQGAGSDPGGGPRATPDQLQHLKSWALAPGELPSGTQLRGGGELTNHADAVAAGDQALEKQLTDTGRVDGYSQTWQENSKQLQFRLFFDIYQKPSEAMLLLAKPVYLGQGVQAQNLPDPKLGDGSRMYTGSGNGPNGAKFDSFAIRWVRGRTVLYLDALAPEGTLHQEDIVNTAARIDGRANQAPIK